MDKIKFLKENFFLFENLPPYELEQILSNNGLYEQTFSPKEIIQNCNHCDKIGIVTKGKAIIKSGLDGVIINKLSRNDVYGAAALFDVPKHSTFVEAVTECTVITMDKQFVVHAMQVSSTFALKYVEFLSKKISFLNQKINAFTAKSAENKLYNYLLQIPRTENTLSLSADMSTIAKMLGIGRATLYRAFEKLEKNGVITKSDKFITFNEV
jgi:CRP-like cAMP-binding protein